MALTLIYTKNKRLGKSLNNAEKKKTFCWNGPNLGLAKDETVVVYFYFAENLYTLFFLFESKLLFFFLLCFSLRHCKNQGEFFFGPFNPWLLQLLLIQAGRDGQTRVS